MAKKVWQKLFPEGRHIFYEGKDPDGFADEINRRFGFDPRKDNPHWTADGGYMFFCPPRFLDKIYGSRRYPMGS